MYRLFFVTLLFLSCQQNQMPEVKEKSPTKIKNIILLIGDGMGLQQLNLADLYLARSLESKYQKKQLSLFTHTKKISISRVRPEGNLVVDSACSATQLSTGKPTLSEAIGVDATGAKPQTILELAKSLGKSTALISNTRITHATPASFAAHTTSRHNENEIAELMLETNVDFMISGGLRHFIPRNYKGDKAFQKKWKTQIEKHIGHTSKRKDNLNLLDSAEAKGYEVSFSFDDFKNSQASKILTFMSSGEMPYAIDLPEGTPSVPEITAATLNKLERNPHGFFLMVEEGLIDWASHANDAGALLHEVLQMDRTYETLLNWVKDRDDTIIIVTADHETGGFGLSYRNRDIPNPVQYPGPNFKDRDFAPEKNYGTSSQLDLIYNQKKSFASLINKDLRGKLTGSSLCSAVLESTGIKLERKICEDTLDQARYLKKLPKSKTADGIHQEYYHNFVNPHLETDTMLGRALSPHQNVVWATGSHTSTPVGVFIHAPENILKKFPPVTTHVELGALMQELMSQASSK